MFAVPFLLDEHACRMDSTKWLSIDYSTSPHILWAGRTGSGKTVAAKLLLARTILFAPPELQPVEVTVIDPKSDTDFDCLDGLPRFYRGEEAAQGFEDFYNNVFRKRQTKEDTTRNLKILFADEIYSMVNLMKNKAEREQLQQRISILSMLLRSFNCSLQLATQQPSVQAMGSSATREQFSVCLLGDSGSETLQMLFDGDSRERIKEFGSIGGRGVGWLSLNGGLAQPVRVPKIENFDKLHDTIKSGVER